MSKTCKECTVWRGKEGTEEFRDWWEGHQHRCEANHLGISGSMDATGLLAIYQHSVEDYSLQHTEFLGDGDSKAHKLIVEEEVFGDKAVTKLECVGHVQKRMGSRLHSLKKRLGQTRLDDGKSIGGTGQLTLSTINKLQVYYGRAIRNNTHDIHQMQDAVMAIWHHSQSTNENPELPSFSRNTFLKNFSLACLISLFTALRHLLNIIQSHAFPERVAFTLRTSF